MLDAACAGEVFTSPTPDQMLEATKVVDRGAGVLHIVKNYTGDVMNFEMGAELAAAESGVQVESVVTNDDVAVEDSTWTAGRRGVGVTVLLEKIVGAAAEEGRDLASVAALARKVNESGRSMGMALTSCTVPAAGKPTFDLPDDQMEMGVGIHGEPGRHRVPLAPASSIAEQLVEPILADFDFTSGPAIVMLNGLGGSPLIELYLMYGEVAKLLEKAGVTVARSLVGNYITSLDMAGCSVTVLKADDEMLSPVGCSRQHRGPALARLSRSTPRQMTMNGTDSIERRDARCPGDWLSHFRDTVTEQRSYLTELDSAIGDADHGANMARGMAAVMDKIGAAPAGAVDELFKAVGMTLVTSVGGASGPLYGTFFLRMGMSGGPVKSLDAAGLGAALRAGLDGVVQRGKAEAGDKTMFDALSPALDAYDASVAAGGSAADGARRGLRGRTGGTRRDPADGRPQGPRELPRRTIARATSTRAPPRPRCCSRPSPRPSRSASGGVTMVGIVVVSHSPRLAEAAVALALEMVPESAPRIAIAAGAGDGRDRDGCGARLGGDRRGGLARRRPGVHGSRLGGAERRDGAGVRAGA